MTIGRWISGGWWLDSENLFVVWWIDNNSDKGVSEKGDEVGGRSLGVG